MIEMIFATLWQPEWRRGVNSWSVGSISPLKVQIIDGQTILKAYQLGLENATEEILGYAHDDVIVQENAWDQRVLAEFEDPTVAMVGFGGAVGHGHPDLYKGEYHLPHLARQGFRSNMRDAETHGTRFTGACNVSILDGFAVFIRKSFLEECGGWPQDGRVSYFMYMEWACCMARRVGYKIRLVGVDCIHLGGKSSGLKQDQIFDYEGEHRYIYEEFRDVLPWRVIP